MRIDILHLVDGAREARGLTVIIDVYRAFTVQAYAFAKGVREILTVGDLRKAYRLKAEHPDYLLVGERLGKQPKGFDYGNSPAAIEHAPLDGKVLIHTTSAGTKGLVNAAHADEVIAGSLVNADAIIRYIMERKPARVSLVAMGFRAERETEEDTLCADYIKAGLLGTPMDPVALKRHLRQAGCSKDYFDPSRPWKPERDFELCTDTGAFDFVITATQTAPGVWVTRRHDVPPQKL